MSPVFTYIYKKLYIFFNSKHQGMSNEQRNIEDDVAPLEVKVFIDSVDVIICSGNFVFVIKFYVYKVGN